MTASYVSLFSSGGVGCFGLKQEGFECVATAELLPRRLDVQKANSVCASPEGYILGDLSDSEIKARLYARVDAWLAEKNHKEITLLIASPPCQGMSVANHKKGNEIVRNSLVIDSIEAVNKIRPMVFVFENVRSFLTTECLDQDNVAKPIQMAIFDNLGSAYNIATRIMNFKDFGSPSSRTRTLVIGVRADFHNVTPWDFMPARAAAPTLREIIGDLPRLSVMGSISKSDIYHSFKPYDPRMQSWITDLKPGESAFSNHKTENRPHRMLNGSRVENVAANGDKYRRNLWDKAAPCVHTRNDILSSQSTIHPEDDRVFSIRELSRMMGVPEQFQWAPYTLAELNSLPEKEKEKFLKAHEMNIRQCLGEAIPTPILRAIGQKINRYLDSDFTTKHAEHLRNVQESNSRKNELAAYYTRLDIAAKIVSYLPDFKGKKTLKVLEPSVGAGAFLIPLAQKYWDREIIVSAVDLDPKALLHLKEVVASMPELGNLNVQTINHDFLTLQVDTSFDIVIGNPPFGKPKKADRNPNWESKYGSKDLFALFIEKAVELGSFVSLLVPKSLASAPEHSSLRKALAKKNFSSICDFGEEAFADIKIETINIQTVSSAKLSQTGIIIDSRPLKTIFKSDQSYIFDEAFPTWLFYRNSFFDKVSKQMQLGFFSVVRDREISSKHLSDQGEIQVIRAANIPRLGRYEEPIKYLNAPNLPVSSKSYMGKKGLLVAPNLSYYPRAMRLPSGCVADGSAAVLVPTKPDHVSDDAIDYFASEEFFYFYRIARNFSTRTLNIDACSVFYWGLYVGPLPFDGQKNYAANSKNIFSYIRASLAETLNESN